MQQASEIKIPADTSNAATLCRKCIIVLQEKLRTQVSASKFHFALTGAPGEKVTSVLAVKSCQFSFEKSMQGTE
jgi:hypothetical protein